MPSLPVSSSAASHHVKDTLIESRGNIQTSEASYFNKLLAAEMSGNDETPDAGTGELRAGPAATNETGNGLVIPGSPASLKDPENTDSKTETEEDRSVIEGNMVAEMLASSFQLSQAATILGMAGITNALHIPVNCLPSAAVTGIETRTTADMRVQQQPDVTLGRMSSGADIAPSSPTDAYDSHPSTDRRAIWPATSLVNEARTDTDARSSDSSGPPAGENAVKAAQAIGTGTYLNPAAPEGSQEEQTAVRTAFSGVVSAAGAKLPQDASFTGTATRKTIHSDSGSSGDGISSYIGKFLPEVSYLDQALPAAGTDAPSPLTLAASVAPHELPSSPQPPSPPPSEPIGIADLPDHPFFRLEPNVGTGGWDNALGQRVLWMVSQQHQLAELNLNPPDLGPLQVVLSVNNDQASAAFVSQNPEVRQALEAALPRLKEMMAESGINLGNATVSDQGSRQQGDFERQNGGRSYYRHGESRIVAAATSSGGMGMSHRVAETGGHQLVDTFA